MPTTQLTVMPRAELRNLLYAALSEIRPIEAKLAEKKTVTAKSRKKAMSSAFFALAVIVFLLGCIFSFWMSLAGVTAAAALLFGPAVFIPLGIVVRKKEREKARAYAQWMDEELVQLFRNAAALKEVPNDYCSSLALEYMVNLLDKGRASTWADCTDKYEEQVHRWKLETNTAEAARYAESAAKAATWAAIGTWWR